MTELEQLNVTLQRQLDAQNARIDNVANKVDLFIAEAQQQREDMRRLQDRQDEDRRKHDADMRRLQDRQDAMQAQHNAEVKGALRHIQNLTIAAMVGIAAIAGATWAFMWSSTRNNLPPPPPAQSSNVESRAGNS